MAQDARIIIISACHHIVSLSVDPNLVAAAAIATTNTTAAVASS